MPILAALLCGLIFGLGLVISGMTDTAKVLGFLDVLAIPQGGWDPTLLIVMAAALDRLDARVSRWRGGADGRCSPTTASWPSEATSTRR